MKITLKSICIFGFLLLPALTHAAANTYYVTQNGNGVRDGKSLSNAWRVSDFNNSTNWSTTDHPNRIDPGDTVYFSGLITTRVEIKGSGSSGNYITLDGYEGGDCDPINAECTSSAELDNSGSFGIFGDYANRDYITVQDFRIKNTKHAMYFSHGSDHITIKRNYTHDNAYAGVRFTCAGSRCSYITIGGALGDGNLITDAGTANGQNLTLFFNTDDIIVSHNHYKITDTATYGVEGLWFYTTDRVLAEYNTVENLRKSHEGSISTKGACSDVIIRFNSTTNSGGFGFEIVNEMTNAYVYGNRFHNEDIWGIAVATQDQRADAHIKNVNIWSNLIYENGYRGIGLQSFDCSGYSCSMSGVNIFNNTIADNGGEHDKTDAGLHGSQGTNISVKNNIFSNNQMITGNQEIYTRNAKNITLSNNEYHDSADEPTLNGISLEDTAIVGDTNFTNPKADDYTLSEKPINEGEDLSGCTDVTVQGTVYTLCYDDGLDPNATDWSTIPPTVGILKRDSYGWDRGAYVYGDIDSYFKPKPVIILSSPSGFKVVN